ncbi:hypothetical protein [uncultured Thiodictyon sp.]|jgi:hypothetical protein|uniref:hypothetical protein n=1 Tax=uncultured Thiodictyon sp. TaxID=1846217 RepID=UPI0025D547E9|nr:hypothetical protein [uncultured Thiodictyon sp.]
MHFGLRENPGRYDNLDCDNDNDNDNENGAHGRDGVFTPSRRFIPPPKVRTGRQVRGKRFGRGECPVRPE